MPEPDLQQLEQRMERYPNLRTAYDFAKRQHEGQKKFGLYPYIIHPLSVMLFLAETLRVQDETLLTAALLHDVVEDCGVEVETLRNMFGSRVAAIVSSVSRRADPNESEEQRRQLKRDFFKKHVACGSRETKLLGIADKLDNVRAMGLIPADHPFRKKFPRWLDEAEAFAELAREVHPVAYSELTKAINERRELGDA